MLKEIILKYALDEIRKPRWSKDKHWISDIGKCPRALVYKWRATPGKEMSPRSYFVFEDGDLHHKAVKDVLRKAGIEFTMEETPILDTERNLKGKLDAVIRVNGKYYVLEIKSVSANSFYKIRRWGVQEEHELQLQAYLYYAQNLFKQNTKEGILLYKCKDTSEFEDFLIKYDEQKTLNFFNTLSEVELHLKNGTLPERPYSRTDWQCRYCEFEFICWEGTEMPTKEAISEITDKELEKMLGNLIYLKDTVAELEKEKEDLTELIKTKMSEKGILSGRIGSYLVKLEERERKTLNKELLKEKLGDLSPFYKVEKHKQLTIKELGI